MHYIVQENIFRETNYQLVMQALDRLKLPYSIVRIFPFVDKITLLQDIPDDFNVDGLPDYNPPSTNVFVFGAVKLARIAQKKQWHPGSMLNDNHDFNVYKQYYKENLLNYDSIIGTVSHALSIHWHGNLFIRPTRDSKAFTGKLFTATEWRELCILNEPTEIFNESTPIQIASPKIIQKEIRLWIVDGKIVTGSQYKLGSLLLADGNYDPEAEVFAQKMIDLFQPAKAFVMDVCLHENSWKIVEINCINASGFYMADMQKLLISLERCWN